jgi:tetratricopeptide (TPR) repeat protein
MLYRRCGAQIVSFRLQGIRFFVIDFLVQAYPAVPQQDTKLVSQLITGLNLRAAGELDAALATFAEAAKCFPANLAARLLQAAMLIELGRLREALALANALPPTQQGGREAARLRWMVAHKALHAQPVQRDDHIQLIDLLLQLGAPAAALARCDAYLSRSPMDWEVRRRRGHALAVLERYEEALAAYAPAPGVADDALLLYNRATVLQRMQRFTEAIAQYELAEQCYPGFADAEFERGNCYLSRGDYARAWPHYEARWRTQQAKAHPAPSAQPRWEGESLAGKRIVLWHEQGFGDSVFCLRDPRYA